jgi:hypothetical protein
VAEITSPARGVEPNRWSRMSGSAPSLSRVWASSRFPSSAALDAVRDGPGQLAAEHLGRAAERIAEPPAPRTAVTGAQAELEEELQVVAARLEHPVVQGLAVVRVGTGLQQQPGGGQDRVLADIRVVPGVGQIEQRLPPERAALAAGGGRIGGQDAPQRPGVSRGGGRVDAAGGDLGMLGEQPATCGPPLRLVVGVVQAHQAEKLVGQAGGIVAGHPVGGTAVALDDLDVPLEAGPAGEAVPARHDQLCGVRRERGGHVGKVLGDLGQRVGSAREDGPPQVLGLVAKLLEAGFVGQGDDRHGDSFRMPAVRVAGAIRSVWRPCSLQSQAGSALPAGLFQANAGAAGHQ